MVALVGGTWNACDFQSAGSVHILCMKTITRIKDGVLYMKAKSGLPTAKKLKKKNKTKKHTNHWPCIYSIFLSGSG